MTSALDKARFVAYDTERYDLAGLVARDVFGLDSLSCLHEHALALLGEGGSSRRLTYQDNLALRRRIAARRRPAPFYDAYDRLVADVLAPLLGGRLSYSLHPTFRVHMAGTESVSNWHTDVEVTGRDDQLNAWVPLIDAFGTNTIWVETDYGRGDYVPVPVSYGEILLFDGGWLLHGSVPNTTRITRVSFDFRFAAKRTDLPDPTLGVLNARPVTPPPSVAERLARAPRGVSAR